MSRAAAYERWCDSCLAFLRRPAGAACWAVLLLMALLFANASADPDLFARAAVGRLIRALGYVPLRDVFAFSPKYPHWIDHEWFAGVSFFWIAAHSGDAGLFLVKLAAAAYSLVLLEHAARIYRGGRPAPIFWLLITVITLVYIWAGTVRSQLFTYLFLPLFFNAFVEHQCQGRRRFLFVLPLVMIIWVNTHGGYVVGLGMLALYTLACLMRRGSAAGTRSARADWQMPAVVLLLCVAATALNPYGFVAFWRYILHAITMPRPTITEWEPVSVLSASALAPNLVAAALLYGLWRSRRSFDVTAVLLIGAAAFFGYRHVRLLALYMMTAYVYGGPLVAGALEMLAAFRPRLTVMAARSAAAVVIVLVPLAAAGGLIGSARRGFRLSYAGYPLEACEWLWKEGRGGRLLVDFNNGSFALWRLFPRYQVSLDGRYEELYPESTLELVSEALSPDQPGHERAVGELRPDYILVAREVARNFGGAWQVVYEDARFAVLHAEAPGAVAAHPPIEPMREMWPPEGRHAAAPA